MPDLDLDRDIVVPVACVLFVLAFHAAVVVFVAWKLRVRKQAERAGADERRKRQERREAITLFQPSEAWVAHREEMGPPIVDYAEIVLALEVWGADTPSGRNASFGAKIHLFTPVGLLPKLAPGATIPVRYNPREPTDLVLDWDALGVETPYIGDRAQLEMIAHTRQLMAEM